jgi:electron-transferring-flavoprotein dehydrogenase
VKPADYPPPWTSAEALAVPADADPIEVGILIVGAGPAGLAAAIRLGQLAQDDPGAAARLGEAPIAVLEKGRAVGSHLLSGAILDPRALERLFQRPVWREELPVYGEVHAESVLYLTPTRAIRIPTPPTMRKGRHLVCSLAQLGRWLADRAEAVGATVLPETSGQRLLVEHGRVVGVRTGDKGLNRDGTKSARFEAGSDVKARVTILAEGTQGYLTGAALERFGLAGAFPQAWALGVKEVWKVARPLDRVIHTMGWPLRASGRYREFGGSFVYPLGDELVTVGMVVGLDYRDAGLSAHDLLQELKTHPRIRRILDGGDRVEWGAKTIPEGGFVALPQRCHARGLLLCGDGAGFVNVPALKGIDYAMESGRLAAEAAWGAVQPGARPDALAAYDVALKESFVWDDLRRVRNMRQVFGRGFWSGAALAGLATLTGGRLPPGNRPTEADVEQPVLPATPEAPSPAPDGRLTFDKLSSVYLSGNRTRDDQPNHIALQRRVPLELAGLWVRMCPAQVYELGEAHDDGTVDVVLAPSNCVQCGAITAKGGRLTPPEGGSGPEYKLS